MLKTQITGAKYLSPQTNQMTNLNIAVPADSKDTEFGTSDIMLAKDTVKLIEDKTKDKDTDKSYFELKLVEDGSVIIDGIKTELKSRQLFRWEGKPLSLVIDGNIGWSDFSHLDTSAITSFENMFKGYDDHSATTSLNVGNWDMSNATSLERMFERIGTLINVDVGAWDVSNVKNMSRMFDGCTKLSVFSGNHWDVSNVTDMSEMFNGCKNLDQLDLEFWDVSNVTDFSYMFSGVLIDNFTFTPEWNMSKATSISGMFYGCTNLKTISLGDWDISNVTNMSDMFHGCINLSNDEFDPNFGLEYLNTSNVTNLYGMFKRCLSVGELNLSNFNTAKVLSFGNMFFECTNLKKLDISGFDTSSADINDHDGLSNMFYGCSSLKSLILGEGFGKMPDNVGSVDFSNLSEWTDQDSVKSLLTLYDRKANGMGEITLKLHNNTKAVLGSDGQAQLIAKGYRIE